MMLAIATLLDVMSSNRYVLTSYKTQLIRLVTRQHLTKLNFTCVAESFPYFRFLA